MILSFHPFLESLQNPQVDPKTASEEMVGIILYTLEMEGETAGVISSDAVHGRNCSLYGVMNWSTRVFRDCCVEKTPEQKKALCDTINLFLPLLARVDTFLSRMPLERQTLFRGIRAPIRAEQYSKGLIVPWTALSSTSADFKKAHEFGFTLFLVHVHNASSINFLTMYPEEAEYLLPTYTLLRAIGVVSPTLLKMLGSSCSYIMVQAVGDVPSVDQNLARLQNRTGEMLIFKSFMEHYVQARLYPAPPPLARIVPLPCCLVLCRSSSSLRSPSTCSFWAVRELARPAHALVFTASSAKEPKCMKGYLSLLVSYLCPVSRGSPMQPWMRHYCTTLD